MKIKSIYIDGLHNAVNKTYNFGDVNYIYGNNGIGKSTILQAIQLALLGYIPGTAKNSKEALLRHSPKGKIEVTISLTDTENDSDIIVNRRITTKTTEVNIIPSEVCISDIIKDIELPIFNFNEFVGQTANKLKEYFIKNILPTSDGALNWKEILTEAISDCNFTDKDVIIKYGLDLVSDVEGGALDQVIAANTKFKDDQSFNKTELQRLQHTIESLIFYGDYTGTTNLDELNTQILSLGALRDQVIKYDSAMAARKSLDDEETKLKQRFEQLGGNAAYLKEVENTIAADAKIRELEALINAANVEISELQLKEKSNNSVINGGGLCPYTKSSCQTITDKIASLQAENAITSSHIAELKAKLTGYNNDLYNAKSTKEKSAAVATESQYILTRLSSLSESKKDLPAKPNTEMTAFEIDQKIAALTQDKEKLQANIQYNATIDNLTKMKYDLELKNEALAKWVKKTDTNGLQTTLMETPFKDLADTLTNLIQAMYDDSSIKAHFNISTKANSFSFGLIRNEIYIPYDLLSSGEKCLYTLALMICITNADKSPLKLLLCDDMFDHLDSKAIESTFYTLMAYNKATEKHIQFIFAGVKECENAKDILITV